jgi:hypothetical protein
MGGRSRLGLDTYFEQTLATWIGLRRLLAPSATVVQLVAFADPSTQLVRYLETMERAGYQHRPDLEPGGWRDVPSRRWYYRVDPNRGASREVLLVHQARPLS